MGQKIYHLIVVGLFVLSVYGWGRLTRRFLDRRIFIFHSLTAVIGLAMLGTIGGVLNLFHLVNTPMLLLLVAVGAATAIRFVLRKQPWKQRAFRLESIPLFVAPVVALGTAWLLMPSSVFNIADDFHTYVTRAVRMAETGSLAGNAFDSLGTDSLGSASFFHCFFLVAGGVEFLNGFDAIACFALCLFFVAELSLRWRMPWWLGLCAMFGLIWINPQYVNISPLYAGAAGIMALTLCGLFLARALARNRLASVGRFAAPIGLLVAWLATMKITLAFFAAIYLSLLLLTLLLLTKNRRAVLKTALAAGFIATIGILPWASVPVLDLLRLRHAAEPFFAGASLTHKYPSVIAHDTHYLFDPIALLYGNTPVFYLIVCGVAFALGLAGLLHCLRQRARKKICEIAGISVVGLAMLSALIFNSHIFPIAMAIRYSCPFIIGGAFIVALGFVRFRTSVLSPSRWRAAAVMAAVCVTLIVSFNETFLERLDSARWNQTLLAWNVKQNYAEHSRDMLAPSETAYHVSLQTNIPPGSTALVWTTTPFHFDFRRNQLLTLTVPGISSPALHFPAGAEPQALERYLRSNHIEYVIMETNGYGVVRPATITRMQQSPLALYRMIGDYGAYLRASLDELATRGKVLYSDQRMVVFQLNDGVESLPCDSAPAVSSL